MLLDRFSRLLMPDSRLIRGPDGGLLRGPDGGLAGGTDCCCDQTPTGVVCGITEPIQLPEYLAVTMTMGGNYTNNALCIGPPPCVPGAPSAPVAPGDCPAGTPGTLDLCQASSGTWEVWGKATCGGYAFGSPACAGLLAWAGCPLGANPCQASWGGVSLQVSIGLTPAPHWRVRQVISQLGTGPNCGGFGRRSSDVTWESSAWSLVGGVYQSVGSFTCSQTINNNTFNIAFPCTVPATVLLVAG